MRAISLWQPWASLMALNLKVNETRSWQRSYRGTLAIHAAKKIVPFDELFDELSFAQRLFIMDRICEAYGDYNNMPTGKIVAICTLTNIRRTEDVANSISWLERACGDYSENRFAWETRNMKPLVVPIAAAGKQGLWEWGMPI